MLINKNEKSTQSKSNLTYIFIIITKKPKDDLRKKKKEKNVE